MTRTIDRTRLAELSGREAERFAADHPASAAAYAAANHLFGRVPMTWMNKKAGAFPLYAGAASGSRVTDLDGRVYRDFALGDTGAMAGHAPAPVAEAIRRQVAGGGLTTMMPTEDAEWVGGELARRFGMAAWSFSLSATDANRWAIRLARALTGRQRILVHSWCYHGTVDETLIVVDEHGQAASRDGNVGAPVPVTETSRVVEINDLTALERELAHGDVAAVLMEPALTNIGIVLPDEGYHAGVRELTRAAGSLLIIDETHTFSAGPGGATAAWGLEPDVLVIGKAIGGGVPAGAYGLSSELADRLLDRTDLDLVDMGGVGGTLAGNPLSLAAVRATLGEVLTEEAFAGMIDTAVGFESGVAALIAKHDLPWSVTRLGARAEYRFASPAPRNGGESAAAADGPLEDYLHLALANRGILLTPFHNMALMAPSTTAADVDEHHAALDEVLTELLR